MKALGKAAGWSAIVGLLLGSTFALGEWSGSRDQNKLIMELGNAREDITVVRNENASLEEAILESEANRQDLLDTIASLKQRPIEIEYIVVTKTTVEPIDRVVEVKTLPESHKFTWDNGLVVAEFKNLGETYKFITHPMTFSATTVISDKKTAVLFEGTSGFNDHKATLHTEVTTTKTPEHKKLEPHVGVGITGGYPSPDLRANIFGSAYHPTPSLDVGVVRLSANKTTASIGLDPVSYNLGAKLPVVTDLWLSAGADYTTDNNAQFTLSLGSKF